MNRNNSLTVIVFSDPDHLPEYAVVEGVDCSKFDGQVVGAMDDGDLEQELTELLWTEDGGRKIERSAKFPLDLVREAIAANRLVSVITCGIV